MNKNTYLNSLAVADVFDALSNAFNTFRDEFDGRQSLGQQHTEDILMDVILQQRIISDPMLYPLIRELLRAILAEPLLYSDWTESDHEFFRNQMDLDLVGDEEFSY